MSSGLIPKFSEYLSCFNSKQVLVLLRLPYVIAAKHVSVLHPRAAVVMGNVPPVLVFPAALGTVAGDARTEGNVTLSCTFSASPL